MWLTVLKFLRSKATLILVGVAAFGGAYAYHRYVVNDRNELRAELTATTTERDAFQRAMAISQEAMRQYAIQQDADRRALNDLRSQLNEEGVREWAAQPVPPALVCRWKGEQCGE